MIDISLMSNYNENMKTRDAISMISKIREKVNKSIVDKMAEHGMDGIATSHGDIIYALFGVQKLTMAEIADRIGKDKSTVTALVDKLVRLGYVVKERDTEDTRVVFVMLTPKGQQMTPMFEQISFEIVSQFYQGVSDQEKEVLIGILEKIYYNF